MTMPKGWREGGGITNFTEVEKKYKEEMDKIFDFYYEVVKSADNDPNVSEEEREKLRAQYFKMKNDRGADNRKLVCIDSKPLPRFLVLLCYLNKLIAR